MGQIDFYAWYRGYAPSGEFSDSGSRRFRDFTITGGAVQSDEITFIISANILQWESGQRGYPKSDAYDKYSPRLMIGVYDSTSPNGLDYKPMVGLEFNMDFYSFKKIFAFDTRNTGHSASPFSPNTYFGQTFNLGFPYILSGVAFYIQVINGNPGKLVCEVKETDANGHPTGDVLASGTLDNYTTGWQLFRLNNEVKVSANTMYSAYAYAKNGSNDNKIYWGADKYGTYPDGTMIYSSDGGSTWKKYDGVELPVDYDMTFRLYGHPLQAVRPFLCKDITTESPSYPEYRHGDWAPTGSSYKIQLVGENLELYTDNNLKETWDISDVTLDGGYKFGKGYTYNWNKFRIQLIDTASSGVTYTNTPYYDDYIAGAGWEYNPGHMTDGSTTTYARETRGGSYYEYLDSNTFSVSDNISIVKVEVRVHGRTVHLTAGDWAYIYIQPRFYRGGNPKWGSTHLTDVPDYYPTQGSMNWSNWIDITSDNNAPSEWTKEEVENLLISVIAKNSSFSSDIYCDASKVELRVTYMKYGDVGDYGNISGNITYYSIAPVENPVAISDDGGSSWTIHSNKRLNYVLGWNYDYITGRKTASTVNLEKYGTHLYTINEPLITTRQDAEALAQQYLETYMSGIKVGSLTIEGRTNIDLTSKFRLSGTYLDFNEVLEIASYTHRIDKNGFTTTINYGTEPFDIAKKVANLENEVYG